MIKKLLVGTAFALVSASAFAADLPVRAAAPAPIMAAPAFSFAGFYVGAVGTVGMMNSQASDYWCHTACDAPDQSKWGGGIGGTIGYNFQSGSFVYGLEADASWVQFKNSYSHEPGDAYVRQQTQWDWYSTIRARMGLAFDRTLAYVTGGVAFVGMKNQSYYFDSNGFDGGFRPVNDTVVGFAVGVGVEHFFTPNWSVKAEYMYIGTPSQRSGAYCNNDDCTSIDNDGRMIWQSDAHVARIGVNYKFGSSAAPVVARY